MRFPSVQLTVRQMMIAVAISAITIGSGAWAVQMWRYSSDLRRHAAVYRVNEQSLVSMGYHRQAEQFALMRRKYEDAARHPWSGVADDPPPTSADGPGIDHANQETGAAGVQRHTGTVRVTVEILSKPDGEPYQHGEQIRCKGRIAWTGAGPPRDTMAFLQPGFFPDSGLPGASARFLPVKVTSVNPDSSSGTAEWEGSIRANRVLGIDDYVLTIVPLDENLNEYQEAGRPVHGFQRLRIPR